VKSKKFEEPFRESQKRAGATVLIVLASLGGVERRSFLTKLPLRRETFRTEKLPLEENFLNH